MRNSYDTGKKYSAGTMGEPTNSNYVRKFVCTDYDILIVGENEPDRKDVGAILYDYGVVVDEADSTDMAIKLAKEHKYDMVFVYDGGNYINAPQIVSVLLSDGCKGGNMPIMIAFTEKLDKNRYEMYLRNDMCDVISLPSDRNVLHRVLDRWILEDRKIYLDEADEESSLDAQVAGLFMEGVNIIEPIRQNGGIDEYLDLLELFYIDGMKRISYLDELIDNKDYHNYIIEVHGLKNAAANIGADKLSQLSKEHEFAGKDSRYDFIEEDKSRLFECYDKILEQIKGVLQKVGYGQFDKKEKEKLPPLDKAEVQERLKKILGQLQSFRSGDASQGVDELLEHTLEDSLKAPLEQIQMMLRLYEDDKAEEKLGEIIEKL